LRRAFAALASQAQASADTIRIGYQNEPDPSHAAIVDGAYEKATGDKIEWRKFDSGASVIAAPASNAIDIGYSGSSPLAAGVTRGAPIETFLAAGLIGKAEGLVVRNGSGINDVKDLVGKKVATPFVSTSHYSLLYVLKHAGVDPTAVNILNLQPPEIAPPSPGATSTPPMSGTRFSPRPRRTARSSSIPRESPSSAVRPSSPGSPARILPRSIPTSSRRHQGNARCLH
jgi:ABC-type taurine transport system substrate-binding protein